MGSWPEELYFYEQGGHRKTPKRYRKTQDELPPELRYSHLNPKLAEYFANKDKEQKSEDEFDDGLGKNSLLPQINQRVQLIKQQLHSLAPNEDSQHFLFEEAKISAKTILFQLARILYLFGDINYKLNLPSFLEYYLQCGFKELSAGAQYFPREWQCAENREAAIIQKLAVQQGARPGSSLGLDGRESTVSMVSGGNLTSRSGDTSGEDSKDKDMEQRRKTNHKTLRVQMPGGGLSDIAESEEFVASNTATSRLDDSQECLKKNAENMPKILAVAKKESDKLYPKPKTRLEKYRFMDPGRIPERSHTSLSMMKRQSSYRDDAASTIAGSIMSESAKSLERSGYYMSVIQFQLSSKLCDEKGWIVHPGAKDDPERETVLEWATQRLQLAIKEKKEQASADKAKGLDKPVVLRCYGERDGNTRYSAKRSSSRLSATPMFRGQKPNIPPADYQEQDDRRLFLSTVSDGSTTVFYPSGKPAILYTRAGIGKKGYYTIAYEDSEEQQMLAALTPSGRGACYHLNGVVRFLATKTGGTLNDTEGGVIKRWDWPANGAKLQSTIVVQLNSSITLRCQNQHLMQLQFSHAKENIKLQVGMADGADAPPTREDLGHILTGFEFSSQTARDFAKQFKPKPSKSKGKLGAKHKEKKGLQADMQKLLEFPEPTENDANSDKELYRLQRKIKTLVEDWLEHYRIAVGVRSPHIRSMRDKPNSKRYGAKSASGERKVLIEREATSIAKVSVQRRVQSAVPGSRDRPASSIPENAEEDEAQPHEPQAVTFDDNPEEMESPDTFGDFVFSPIGFLPGSAGSNRSGRKSAPKCLSMASIDRTMSPPQGTCPVALRQCMLREERPMCRCTRHKIPYITDVEYDEFVVNQAPYKQLIIVAVVSSLFPDQTAGTEMLQNLYMERNKNRTRPCMQSRSDPYRLFFYDLVNASDCTGNSQPLLLRRHNVAAGMVLMYQGGKLLFCDHIFNGYGNARRDFHKQIMATQRAAMLNQSLPQDFRFSPLHGKKGSRSAWGGQIGGAGVDRHGSPGVTLESGMVKRPSSSSLSSGDSSKMSFDYQISQSHLSKTAANKPAIRVWSRYSSQVY